MPLYDYRCQNCGDFEAWRKLADLDTPMVCPDCDADVQRLFSPPNINLNSGRFVTASKASQEPRLLKRERAGSQPKNQSSTCARPWMIGHATERL